MDQQSVAPAVIERPPMRVGNVIGWFVLLVLVAFAAQGPAGESRAGVLAAALHVAFLYGVGAIAAGIYVAIRQKRYSHTFALSFASVLIALPIVNAASERGIPGYLTYTREFVEGALGGTPADHPRLRAAAEQHAQTAETSAQEAFHARYVLFLSPPARQHLAYPPIKERFDADVVARIARGQDDMAALMDASKSIEVWLIDSSKEPALSAFLQSTAYSWITQRAYTPVFRSRFMVHAADGSTINEAAMEAAADIADMANQGEI